MKPGDNLSVFSTLKEALLLWMRNFGFILLVVVLTRTPFLLLRPLIGSSHPHDPFGAVLSFLILFVSAFFITVKQAAVLGILAPSSESSSWKAAWNSVLDNANTLFRVAILLGIIAIPFALVFGLIVRIIAPGKLMVVLMTALFLFFLKYALADPLVVAEGMGARAALRRSWRMTKGHFGYVAGCYLAVGATEWALQWSITSPRGTANAQITGTWLLAQLFISLIGTMWVVLSWCMYLRIKKEDASEEEPLDF